MDADRFAFIVVHEIDLRNAHQDRTVLAHFKAGFDTGADHLLWRDIVHILNPGPHELNAASRDDVGPEIMRSQEIKQFQHGLVDHLNVEASGSGVSGAGGPVYNDLFEFLAGVASMCGKDDLDKGFHPTFQNTRKVICQHSLEGLLFLPLGVLAGQRLDSIQGKGQLEIKWFFRPERAIVVKDSDAIEGRHEFGSPLGGHRLDKLEDRGFAWPCIPGGRGAICASCFFGIGI